MPKPTQLSRIVPYGFAFMQTTCNCADPGCPTRFYWFAGFAIGETDILVQWMSRS